MRTKSEAHPGSRRSLPRRYGVAVASVAIATGLKLLIEPLLQEQDPFSAVVGGLCPGVMATVLGALSADYFYLDPVGAFTEQQVEGSG